LGGGGDRVKRFYKGRTMSQKEEEVATSGSWMFAVFVEEGKWKGHQAPFGKRRDRGGRWVKGEISISCLPREGRV